jgi:hypothetical protein
MAGENVRRREYEAKMSEARTSPQSLSRVSLHLPASSAVLYGTDSERFVRVCFSSVALPRERARAGSVLVFSHGHVSNLEKTSNSAECPPC